MNVLVLDDQSVVLDGLRNGIDWEKHGVTLYLTSSTDQARKIFDEHSIQIFFCDIEMPGENGISMVRWAATYHPNTINIFLTSHADFSYARDAVALGAFDYVLQPAPYAEIERVLKKAIEKYKLDNRRSQLYHYGQYIERKRGSVSENLCYDLLYNRLPSFDRFFKDLSLLNYHFTETMRYTPVLLQLLDDRILKTWDPDTCQWSMENILTELVENSGKEALIYSAGWSEYYLIFGQSTETETEEICKQFLETIHTVLPYAIAIYAESPCPIGDVHLAFNRLGTYLKNNVFLQEGYFNSQASAAFSENPTELTDSVYAYWKSALERDMTEVVHVEVQRYLDRLSASRQANFSTMLNFHQKISQLFLHILSLRNQDLSKIFTDSFTYSDFSNSYQTIHDLQQTVDFVFQSLSGIQKSQSSYSDLAREYVLANLQENIQVQEIADHIGLTPDYLSRNFKKETGMSLKDFILSTKVDAAKQQLRSTNRSVSAIAMELGYDNVSNFIQTFKKITGVTPVEYKKNLQEERK